MLKILLVHQNFPGQFRGLTPALLQAGHQVRAISMRPEKVLAGVPNFHYKPSRGSSETVSPTVSTLPSSA